MGFGIIGRVTVAFILEALGAFARPAPDTEPNIEGKTDDPEGVPCTQWLSTCIPLVF